MKNFMLNALLIAYYLTILYAVIGLLIIRIVHPAAIWFRWSVAAGFILTPILIVAFILLVNRKN